MQDTSSESQEWITTKEAAKRLGKSVRYVRSLIHEGRLRARRQGNIWLVHSSLSVDAGAADGILTESPGNTRETVTILKAQLEVKDKQIEALQGQLEAGAEASERHDTIVLQLTRQVEQSQRLLEYSGSPWYRRWFRKGRKPPEDMQSD